MLLALLMACGSDIAIITKNQPRDTSTVVDSAPPTPATEPGDTQVPGLEGIGGYFNYSVSQLACPACLGETQSIQLSMTAQFHDPTNQSHTAWIPAPGECVTAFDSTVPSVTTKNYGNKIVVNNSFRTMEMYFNINEYTGTIYESQYDRDTLHTVLTDGGSFEFETIHGFDTLEPQTMLYVDPSYAFAAPIYRSGATFWWTPANNTGEFMVTIAVYSADGSSMLGYVSCVTGDVGQLTIPGNYLSMFPQGSLAAIHLERHKVALEEFVEQGTFIETHMTHQVIGTGMIQ